MTAEPYEPCPCGSGKKVKFCCCKDIAAELGRVMRALEGDQRVSALGQLNRLLTRVGDRPALLVLKAEVQVDREEWDGAEKTAEALASAAPDSPVAPALLALAAAQRGECEESVANLQRVFERISGVIAPVVEAAIYVVGRRLLDDGHVIAAREHFLVSGMLRAEEDDKAMEPYFQLVRSPQLPLLLKERFDFLPPPDGAPWKDRFDEARDLVGRGAWLAGCRKLEAIAEQAPDEPTVIKNAAVLHSWLGNDAAAAAALRRYAALDAPLDDAVEAEALAQLLDTETPQETIDVLRITHPIRDVEKLTERLLSDERMSREEIGPTESEDPDEPPPRAIFLLLDRPLPRSSEGLTLDAVPLVIGQAAVFGRQTDREARLEFTARRTSDFAERIAAVVELAGDAIGPVESEDVLGREPASQEALAFASRLPNDTPPPLGERLTCEQRRKLVMEKWPEFPVPALDGKSPREAADDPAYRIRLLARVLLLEEQGEQQMWDIDFEPLRRRLGLPTPEPIDPDEVDVSQLPITRLSRLRVGKLSDEDLKAALSRAVMMNAVGALRVLALEAARRDDGPVTKSAAYDSLVRLARNSSEALQYNEKARQAAVAEGESDGRRRVRELAFRIGRKEVAESHRLIQQITTDYRGDEETLQALYELLARLGLISLDEPLAKARSARQSGGMDFPDLAAGGRPFESGGEIPDAREKPLIWTPDQG